MNKNLITLLALLFGFGVCAQETESAEPATAEEAVKDVNTTSLQEDNVDEIDLEDDSAIAAKKPKVNGNLENGLNSLVDIECDEAPRRPASVPQDDGCEHHL